MNIVATILFPVGAVAIAIAFAAHVGHAVLLANGTMSPRNAFFHHDQSQIVLLRIEGKKVQKVAEMEIGPAAKGLAFSPDGRFLYAGSFVDGKIVVLRIQGTKLVQVGELALGGHPASLRGSTP